MYFKKHSFLSWFMILLQNDAGNACLLGFAKAMQYPSKFQKICYGVHPHSPRGFFFFFCFWNFSYPPTYYPPLSPINVLTYIFKLKINSSPSTYSPINLKCATLIPTHLPTPHLFFNLPNPTYMVTPTYLVRTPITPNGRKQLGKNETKVLHGSWSCETPPIKVLQVIH